MVRPELIVAASTTAAAQALHRAISLVVPNANLPHQVKVGQYRHRAELTQGLAAAVAGCSGRDVMAVVDLTASQDGHTPWDLGRYGALGLGAELVLSFPEVYFIFLDARQAARQQLRRILDVQPMACDTIDIRQWGMICAYHFADAKTFLAKLSRLVALHRDGFRTLFDPTGLRSALKMRLFRQQSEARPLGVYRPFSRSRVDSLAAVADEEPKYVYLNGYAAYKAGFAAWLLVSQAEFTRLIGRRPGPGPRKPPPRVVPEPVCPGEDGVSRFELALADRDLAYADQSGQQVNRYFEELAQRSRFKHLISITSFPEPPRDGAAVMTVAKPYGGFYALLSPRGVWWRRGLLERKYRRIWEESRCDAEAYPAAQPAQPAESAQPHGPNPRAGGEGPRRPHSAPNSVAPVATALLLRARVLQEARPLTTESWIHIAVLAGEAKELVGGLSRTIVYEAVGLQNEAEVQAEVGFYGTAADIRVKPRIEMLDEEARLVQTVADGGRPWSRRLWRWLSRWLWRPDEWTGHLNFMAQTVNNLRRTFAAYEQVEAAEYCLRAFAKLDRRLARLRLADDIRRTFGGHRAGRVVAFVLRFPIFVLTRGGWYTDFATRAGTSIWRLLSVSAIWVAIFTAGYDAHLAACPATHESRLGRWRMALSHSCFSFIEVGKGDSRVHDRLTGQPDESATPAPPAPGSNPPTSQAGAGDQTIGPASTPVRGDGRLGRLWDNWTSWMAHIPYRLLLFLNLVVAYLHIGLLLSLLYRRITKRAP